MKKTLLFLFFFLQFFFTKAQNPTDVDTTFGVFPGFNNIVLTTAVQSDGKILVGGYFISFQGLPANYLIRLNPDGSKDESFNLGKGLNGVVFSIVVQTDGKIIVGGNFTKYQDINQNYLVRLNPDGSKDNSFNIGSGFTKSKDYQRGGTVHTLLVQPDGKIIVGGGFNSYQGSTQNYLIRLNSDGTKDATFDIGNGFDSIVYCLSLQNNGRIVVGGGFNKFQGTSQNSLIRLNNDGSIDRSLNIGTGFNSAVRTVLIHPNEKILAGGWFFQFNGEIKTGLICLNTDGTKDISFNLKFGLNNNVESLCLQPDGKIIAGGNFVNYNKNDENHVIRLNNDGSVDNSFKTGTGFGIANGFAINTITLQNNGRLLIGGDFLQFQENRDTYLTRLNADGSKDNSFTKGNGLNSLVNTVILQSDNKILVGGKFTLNEGVPQNYLTRFNSDGSKDSSFNIENGFNNVINTISQQIDGKIIVGGAYNKYKNENNYSLIRLNSDGSKDNSFNIGNSGFSSTVNCTAIQTDGKILVGGLFSNYQNVSQNRLVRLNIDGSKDNSFNIGTGFDAEVLSIALQPDGKIILGGKFKNYNGISQNYLTRLNSDGSKDNSFDIGTGFGSIYTLGDVLSIVVQTNGKIIIGGRFTFYQGKSHNYIIRLNSDGSIDSSFKSNTGFSYYVNSIAIQKDGKIIAAGGFSLYNNNATDRIARLNPDGTIDNSFSGNKFSLVYNVISDNDTVGLNSIALQNDGKIVLGGAFTSYKTDLASAFLIRLQGNYIATPLISKITPTHITCSVTTGSASIAVSGGRAPYSYLWSNGETTAKITGLAAGDYSCKITDTDLITITENFSITTIADTENPTITAPINISVNTNINCTTTGLILGTPITADNCSATSVTNDAPLAFPIGNTIVTWTIKDANNNSATATQIVTVKDATLPTIIAPNAIIVNVNTNCTATGVLLGNPVTADNCSVASVTNNAPTAFPIGNTTVIWTAKDSNNNTATATQIVTVNDAVLPTIKAPAPITVNANTNCTATDVVLGTPVTADNCYVASVTNNAPSAFPIGETTVTWTVKDGSNNTATAIQIVTVKGIDATITNNAGILTAVEAGATYKWLECSNGTFTAIPNENKVSFTPKKTGSYAVEITKNGCSATSTCYEVKTLGTNDFDLENSLKLYPNPTKDFVTIELNTLDNARLKIVDVNGQFILSKELKTTSNTINISHLASGVYIFEISNDNGKAIKKVIKK